MTDTQTQTDQFPAVDSLWRNADGGISTVTAVKHITGQPYISHTTDGPCDNWSVSLTALRKFLAEHTPEVTS